MLSFFNFSIIALPHFLIFILRDEERAAKKIKIENCKRIQVENENFVIEKIKRAVVIESAGGRR